MALLVLLFSALPCLLAILVCRAFLLYVCLLVALACKARPLCLLAADPPVLHLLGEHVCLLPSTMHNGIWRAAPQSALVLEAPPAHELPPLKRLLQPNQATRWACSIRASQNGKGGSSRLAQGHPLPFIRGTAVRLQCSKRSSRGVATSKRRHVPALELNNRDWIYSNRWQ